ncbi:MAG: UDP-N-acetylglucosamine diphosphorylase/glucosamine-1-phosphate N-acetyltransferase [Gammaproteobacteria bacterium]|nr:UDP-N-acetylglucosamine diphosphorylase/glucosamine-1-phosphate N-acetyltransferase [Gammaproteobacteria bacterium]
MTNKISIVILAAGQGTRMKSDLPKVLHVIGNKSLLEHVIETANELDAKNTVVVYGHGGELVPDTLSHLPVKWVEQSEQLGTGHAVSQAIPDIAENDIVLVLYGDVPLIKSNTLKTLVDAVKNDALGLLTVQLADPTGYGRIVRNSQNQVVRIVEQKDANEVELKINEINTGFMAVKRTKLFGWLNKLDNNNSQGEYYLTDIIALAVSDNVDINTTSVDNIAEVMGINDKIQLANMERQFQLEQVQKLMLQGVTLRDPGRIDVRGKVTVGKDVTLDVNVIMEGEVKLGNRVTIGAGVVLRDVVIGDDVNVKPYCVFEEATIGVNCQIGPFSRIRPGTKLAEDVRIGNFVEIKKSQIDKGSKINHLSYIGDTVMGSKVNIGAGTITCNYDGANKHQTQIGNDVFVGSDTQFIAPVKVGDGATIGAGSTITKEVPARELTLGRIRQVSVKGWQRPKKIK